MSEKENAMNEASEEQAVAQNPEDASTGSVCEVPEHVELTALLEDVRGKADEHWNQCLRLQADMENLRKRSERELANAHKYALDRFAQELLPVRDSLELGLAAFDNAATETGTLREGIDLTLQMLSAAMNKFDIREINPQDERFDPDFHQAMSLQERADVEPNTVVTVVQKGYLLNDRLIRPAMVIVSKLPADNAAD